jgi:hypothetical protein
MSTMIKKDNEHHDIDNPRESDIALLVIGIAI